MQNLFTSAGETLTGMPWNTYPRPQLVRKDWLCLNGQWEFISGGTKTEIRVPFCPESLLSGVNLPMEYGREMVYSRRFTVPEDWQGKRILLHFGAVSRKATVRINGKEAVSHDESYLSFSADITDLVCEGENELSVTAVNDLSHQHPWGKQKEKRGGMWYTPVSGIWQTVWLEPVPERYIHSLTIHTGRDYAEITVNGAEEGAVEMNGVCYPLVRGTVRIGIEDPVCWSPENPYLYRFTVAAGEDRAEAYFALRTLSVERVNGIRRLCLNGKPYFFHGLLDQGYWSDGLYTPADPSCYEADILAMKALGFNMLRKHIPGHGELRRIPLPARYHPADSRMETHEGRTPEPGPDGQGEFSEDDGRNRPPSGQSSLYLPVDHFQRGLGTVLCGRRLPAAESAGCQPVC